MKAAIYARKSNDDDHRAREDKSVSTQIAEARKYAIKKGWTVSDEFIFVDDGISGAEFENRPGFARLLATLPKKGQQPSFDVLIMSELSRLGRDTHRTPFYVAEILDSKISVWTYLNDSEEKNDNPEVRLMTSVRAYSDEAYRIRTAERVRSRLARMAQQGLVTGGSVYGYRSVPVFGGSVKGEQVRSHCEWKIDEDEAKIVRAIFTMYADGFGHTTIAKALNGDPRPRYAPLSRRYFGGKPISGPRNGRGTWASSSIREMLHRERYIGRLIYGRVKNNWKRGTKERRPAAESDVVSIERADLRIVPDSLWREVQARLASVRKTYIRDTKGNLYGRPGMGVESRYLLTGFGRCATCESNIVSVGGLPSAAHRRAIYYYGCSWHSNKGASVCKNDVRLRMEQADEIVRATMKRVMTPAAVEKVLDRAVAKIAEQKRTLRPESIEVEIRKLRAKRNNLIALAEDGKASEGVRERLAELDGAIDSLNQRLTEHRSEALSELDRARIRKGLRERIAEFDRLVQSNTPVARQALRKLLDGPIVFDARSGNYVLRGRTKVGPLISKDYVALVPRKGLEPPQCCHR